MLLYVPYVPYYGFSAFLFCDRVLYLKYMLLLLMLTLPVPLSLPLPCLQSIVQESATSFLEWLLLLMFTLSLPYLIPTLPFL